MKKAIIIAIAGLALLLAAGAIVFRTLEAKEQANSSRISARLAQELQAKIDAIKKAGASPGNKPGASHVEISEFEFESYLLFSLKDDIPVQIDSADVQLEPDTVGLDTQITFPANATNNPVVDALLGGTHNLFLKGRFIAQQGRGKFDLQEIRVDGIPVPNVLIQSLFKKYVKPEYPEADLNEPFDLPWDIQEIRVEHGKAVVVY